MPRPTRARSWLHRAPLATIGLVVLLLFASTAQASIGDHLPEFRECLEVCKLENCGPDKPHTQIPLHRRLLLWTCPAECDHTCQHIITTSRVASHQPIVQFHGKWPFHRLVGMQEPASVLFSILNLWAHVTGLRKLRRHVPQSYSLLPFYKAFAYVGIAAWTASAIFHTRDFLFTEQVDYFAAGATVLYGLYYTVIRVFRLDRPRSKNSPYSSYSSSPTSRPPSRTRRGPRPLLRAWTILCLVLYAAHVAYLKLYKWDYGYNMMANVVVGALHNVLWSWVSIKGYRATGRAWAAWPGLAVTWVMLAMGLELFDFAPLWGAIDAHSLWHAGTVAPCVVWYNFLVKDAQDDIAKTDQEKLGKAKASE